MNILRPCARSACAIANALDLLGDRWSLLVVRDLLHGKRTYGELMRSPEGISTNILADRLKRLENAGLVTSAPYQDGPVRLFYTLTQKGRALDGVLRAYVRWGKQHVPGTVELHHGRAGRQTIALAAGACRIGVRHAAWAGATSKSV